MIKLENIKDLLDQTDDATLTLYVNVDKAAMENQATTPAWRIWVKNTLRDLDSSADAEAWNTVHDWVQNYFNDYEPTSKGLLIFAGVSFQEVHELPLQFENHATFGEPFLTPLLSAMDEYKPYLVTLVDQESARFFIGYLGEIGFQESMEIDLEEYDFQQKTLTLSSAGLGVTQSSNQEAFDRMIDEHRNRFYRDVIETTQKLAEHNQIRRVILGGSEQSAFALQHLMPDSLKADVVGVLNIPMRYNASDIFQHVLPVAQEAEEKQDMDIVNQVIDFAKSRGRGALGEEAVKMALDMQQVELLILPWPSQKPELSDSLAFQALQLNSKIELVHGEAAERLNEEGGIAARLYYAP